MGNCEICNSTQVTIPKSKELIEIPNTLSERRLKTSDFTIKSALGKGSFGKVFLVTMTATGRLYALKAISKHRLHDQRKKQHTIQERNILVSVKSEFLVKLHYAFQNPQKLFLVLDFMQGGEFYSHMKQRCLSVQTAVFYAAEVLLALEDLHSYRIIYRDLKPENMLMDECGHIRLSDFNLSKIVQDDFRTRTICGTPEYIAPEVLKAEGQTEKLDYWSLGVFLYEMLHGTSPFLANTREQLFANIINANYQINVRLEPAAKSLIKMLLKVNPEERPNLETVKSQRFFAGVDWERLRKKQVSPPIKPQLKGKSDLAYFRRMKFEQNSVDRELPGDNYQGFTYTGSVLA